MCLDRCRSQHLHLGICCMKHKSSPTPMHLCSRAYTDTYRYMSIHIDAYRYICCVLCGVSLVVVRIRFNWLPHDHRPIDVAHYMDAMAQHRCRDGASYGIMIIGQLWLNVRSMIITHWLTTLMVTSQVAERHRRGSGFYCERHYEQNLQHYHDEVNNLQ